MNAEKVVAIGRAIRAQVKPRERVAATLGRGQTLTILRAPETLRPDTALGQYSPLVQFSYSGLAPGQYQIKAWLLHPNGAGPWFHASTQWNERTWTIDNSDGSHPSGTISVADAMDVLHYDAFTWVFDLFDSGTGTRLDHAVKAAASTTNQPPVLDPIGDRTIPRGTPVTWKVSATDPDLDSVRLEAINLPAGAAFDPDTGVFSWTPSERGIHESIGFLAVDAAGAPMEDATLITITVDGRPVFHTQPELTLVEEGHSATLQAEASAPAEIGGITYRWYKNAEELAGARGSSLRIDNANRDLAGEYHATAANGDGITTSRVASVIVPLPRTLEETAAGLMTHLRRVQDQFHETIDIYRDIGSPGNHFHARGFIPGQDAKVTVHGSWPGEPHEGATCMKFTFSKDDTLTNGGGIYLLNGVLIDGKPEPYFGETNLTVNGNVYGMVDTGEVDGPLERCFRGLDLRGATNLVFHARGESGGETVEFFLGGVGHFPAALPHRDSTPRTPDRGSRTVLGREWRRYEIPLAGLDLRDIKGGFGWYAEAIHNAQPTITFYVDTVYLELTSEARAARLEQPRFMRSYSTLPSHPAPGPAGELSIDVAFRGVAQVYDQTIALFAFLSEGTPDGVRRACIIADALVYALQNHRTLKLPGARHLRGFSRLYLAGDLALPPGWEIDGRAATVPGAGVYDENRQVYIELEESNLVDTGDNFWCILALLAAYEAVGKPAYLEAALLEAERMTETDGDHAIRVNEGPYPGYRGGVERISSPKPVLRTYRSVEHHIDAFAAFSRLHAFTGNPIWRENADHARSLVERLWDDEKGGYLAGTSSEPDPRPNHQPGQFPEDTQSWGILGLRDVKALHPNLLGALANHEVQASGHTAYDFADDRDGFWPEALGHISLAHHSFGEVQKARDLLALLPKLQQMPPPHGDGLGIVSASHDFLTSGFGFFWFKRMHIAATGWAHMAIRRYNPYTARRLWAAPRVSGLRPMDAHAILLDVRGDVGDPYMIQTSPDLSVWTDEESLVLPRAETERAYQTQPGNPALFFRIMPRIE